MEPLYMIVHESCLEEGNPLHSPIMEEIERIKGQEDFVSFNGFTDSPDSIPLGITHDRQILVCGAYYSGFSEDKGNRPMCVDQLLSLLTLMKYTANVHLEGTVLSSFHEDHPSNTPKPI